MKRRIYIFLFLMSLPIITISFMVGWAYRAMLHGFYAGVYRVDEMIKTDFNKR
jgi:hypothetical protein